MASFEAKSYKNHAEYQADAPNHLQAIAGQIVRFEIPDEVSLHAAHTVGADAKILIEIKPENRLQTLDEYKQWKQDFQWKLGEALGHYGLVANSISGGAGSEADYEAWSLNYAAMTDRGNSGDEASEYADFVRFKASGTVLVGALTKTLYEHYRSSENTYTSSERRNYEKGEAKERLAAFCGDLGNAMSPEKSGAEPKVRGTAAIVEKERLRFSQKESLAHFSVVTIGKPSREIEDAVPGIVEMCADISPEMVANARRGLDSEARSDRWRSRNSADRLGNDVLQEFADDAQAANSVGQRANDHVRHMINRDLDKYGLVAVNGKWDEGHQRFTFHVMDREHYQNLLNPEGEMNPSKAFRHDDALRQQTEEATHDRLQNYVTDFAKGKQLGLDKAAVRRLL